MARLMFCFARSGSTTLNSIAATCTFLFLWASCLEIFGKHFVWVSGGLQLWGFALQRVQNVDWNCSGFVVKKCRNHNKHHDVDMSLPQQKLSNIRQTKKDIKTNLVFFYS